MLVFVSQAGTLGNAKRLEWSAESELHDANGTESCRMPTGQVASELITGLQGGVNDWDETNRRINGRVFMTVIIHSIDEKAGFHEMYVQ